MENPEKALCSAVSYTGPPGSHSGEDLDKGVSGGGRFPWRQPTHKPRYVQNPAFMQATGRA